MNQIELNIILIAVILFISNSCSQNKKYIPGNSDLDSLASWMIGSFSSQEQAKADSDYFDIRLKMVRIWQNRNDGYWLYVEQASAENLNRPYRQRVYHLSQVNDSTFKSTVYSMNAPLRFAGAWKDFNPLNTFSPDSLSEKIGCESLLIKQSSDAFVGGTIGKECVNNHRGAAYATAQVKITPEYIYSWDRGFDKHDQQVWGARKGGYMFKKVGK